MAMAASSQVLAETVASGLQLAAEPQQTELTEVLVGPVALVALALVAVVLVVLVVLVALVAVVAGVAASVAEALVSNREWRRNHERWCKRQPG